MKTARERITIARTNLVIDHPFFGVLALRLTVLEDPTCETAWTDGDTLGFNPDFIQSLKMDEVMGVVAHDVLHCAMSHQWRRDSRDPERWNHAADYAINPIVIGTPKSGDSGLALKLPAGCLYDKQYEGKSAEWIYAHLKTSNKGGKGGSKPGAPAKGKGTGSGKGKPQPGSGCGHGCDGVRDAKPAGATTEAEWRVATNQAATAARSAGKLPGSLRQFVEQMNEAKVDWRDVLRRFVQEAALRSDYSWKRPNPRYQHSGAYLPAAVGEQTPPMVVAFDTSGSISDAELSAFVGELQSIVDEVQPEVVYSIQCDAQVHGEPVEYFAGDTMGKVKIHGRGGTRFEPVFEEVEKRGLSPAVLVYLTDLEGSFPTEPSYPTIWVSVNKGQAPFGQTIYLNDGGGA